MVPCWIRGPTLSSDPGPLSLTSATSHGSQQGPGTRVERRLPSPHERSLWCRYSVSSRKVCLLKSPRITHRPQCHLYPHCTPTTLSLAAPTAFQSLCVSHEHHAAWALLGTQSELGSQGQEGQPVNSQPGAKGGRQTCLQFSSPCPGPVPSSSQGMGPGTTQKARPTSHELKEEEHS